MANFSYLYTSLVNNSSSGNLGALSTGLLKFTSSAGSATASTAVAATTIAANDYQAGSLSLSNFNALGLPAANSLVLGTGSGSYWSLLAAGSAGNVLTYNGSNVVWSAPATSGTVTSVAASSSDITIGGSPITSSGTLTFTLNTVSIAKGGTGETTQTAAFDALSPMTTIGDLILGGTAGTGTRLAIGSSGNILTVSGGTAVWASPATSGTVTSVAVTSSDLTVGGSPITSSGTITLALNTVSIAHGGTGQITASAGFNALSPMTTVGDLILGGTAGAGTRLGIGSAGNVLTVSGGTAIWAAPATSGTVTSVAVTSSDLTVGGSPITSSGTVTLALNTVSIAHGGTGQTTATAGFNALSPMTTLGDIIIGGASGTGTRLGIGTTGQVLTVTAGSPAWGSGGLFPLATYYNSSNGSFLMGQNTYSGGSPLNHANNIGLYTGTANNMFASVTGTQNLLLGMSGSTLTSAHENVIAGTAELALTTGGFNVILGYSSGTAITTSSSNVMVGYNSGLSMTSGNDNVFVGASTAANGLTGYTQCVLIGSGASTGSSSTTNSIAIGYGTSIPGSNLGVIGNSAFTSLSIGPSTDLGSYTLCLGGAGAPAIYIPHSATQVTPSAGGVYWVETTTFRPRFREPNLNGFLLRSIETGPDINIGTATIAASTTSITVSTTLVTASSLIFLTIGTLTGTATLANGPVGVSNIVPGTSFDIDATVVLPAASTMDVNWWILNV